MDDFTNDPEGIYMNALQDNENAFGCSNTPSCKVEYDIPAGETRVLTSFGAPYIGGIKINGGGTLIIKIGTTKEDGISPLYYIRFPFMNFGNLFEGDVRVEYGLPTPCEPLAPQASSIDIKSVCNSNSYKNTRLFQISSKQTTWQQAKQAKQPKYWKLNSKFFQTLLMPKLTCVTKSAKQARLRF